MEWLQEYLDKLVLVITGLCVLFMGIIGWVISKLFSFKDDLKKDLEETQTELIDAKRTGEFEHQRIKDQDEETMRMLDNILESISKTRKDVEGVKDDLGRASKESSEQHSELKQHVHEEIRRLEERDSENRAKIFEKLDNLNDKIFDMSSTRREK